MSRITGLKYIGRIATPSGVLPFWDSGKRVSPVDLAEIAGFQVAIQNAPNSRERSKAKKALWKWMEGLAERVSIWEPSVSVAVADDGHVVVSSPEYDDERPETA